MVLFLLLLFSCSLVLTDIDGHTTLFHQRLILQILVLLEQLSAWRNSQWARKAERK